jgi:hypothetical protein
MLAMPSGWIRSHNVPLRHLLSLKWVSHNLGHALLFHDMALIRNYEIWDVFSCAAEDPICSWLEMPI